MTQGARRLGAGREFRMIERALTKGGGDASGVVLGWGDDAALVEGGTLAVSTDLSVEGVHFHREWLETEEIGYRAAAAALSDMAAMAAQPVAVLLSVALPPGDENAFEPLVAGVLEAVGAYDATLVGGDLSRAVPAQGSGGIVLDVVSLGSVEGGGVRRSGGAVGDEIWVTGRLGGAALAVSAWNAGQVPSKSARQAFARPVPRVDEARWLQAKGLLHALIDVSDGVLGDVGHLAAASDLDAELESGLIPRFSGMPPESLAWNGGEDYELLFFAPPGTVEPLQAEFAETFSLPLTRIGRTVEGSGEVRVDGRPLDRSEAFDHFRASS